MEQTESVGENLAGWLGGGWFGELLSYQRPQKAWLGLGLSASNRKPHKMTGKFEKLQAESSVTA